MINILKLLPPALLPSWRFFDVIAPSSRVQFVLLDTEDETRSEWQEFRPRPATLSFTEMLKRMLWNPDWNESLFLVSCAERLLEHPTQHSEDEILKRIARELMANDTNGPEMTATSVQFRLLLIQRKDSVLHEHVVFHSRIQPLSALNIT